MEPRLLDYLKVGLRLFDPQVEVGLLAISQGVSKFASQLPFSVSVFSPLEGAPNLSSAPDGGTKPIGFRTYLRRLSVVQNLWGFQICLQYLEEVETVLRRLEEVETVLRRLEEVETVLRHLEAVQNLWVRQAAGKKPPRPSGIKKAGPP